MKNNKLIIFAILLIVILCLGVYFLTKNEEKNNMSSEVSGVYNKSDLFSTRDLKQSADTSSAVSFVVKSGEDITITTEGVYVISGTSSDTTVYVEAASDDKIQIVLNGVSITNTNFPCIYVKSGDKVFITTLEDSSLTVTDSFQKDGSTKTDGVIFSRSDVTLNGTATLTINSSDNGIVSKDDLKITGGTYNITVTSKGIEANDSVRIIDGIINITGQDDGIHAENNDDDQLGYVYIGGGIVNINVVDDGIHAVSLVQIDDGEINITAGEGIEGTYIQINGGNISIDATYDGINAANKSDAYEALFVMNNGTLTIKVPEGDTDAIDSNGDITINGGTIDITATLTFDYVGVAKLNGGKLIINGSVVSEIPTSTK